jgi:hypothetical protein
MTSDDKIEKLEQELASLKESYLHNIRYLARRVVELQEEVDKLSALVPDFAAVEKIAFDAYVASNNAAQEALMEVDQVVPLDISPEVVFNQLPTIREARAQSLERRRN